MNETYYVYGSKLNLIHRFTHNGSPYAVCDDGDGDLTVHHEGDLKKWEETYQYQEQKRKEQEIELLKQQKEEIADEIREKALKTLVSRMKLNLLFTEAGERIGASGMVLVQEIEKLLKDEKIAPKKETQP